MTEPRPVLLVILPADWEAVPKELAELRRLLSDEYGAVLSLRQSSRPREAPITCYVGYWPREVLHTARADIAPRVEAAFFTLDWLNNEVI